MALSLPRWISAALVACLLLGTAVLYEREDQPVVFTRSAIVARQESAARVEAMQAADRLRVFQLRDSLSAVFAASLATGERRVFIDQALDPGVREPIADLVSRSAAVGWGGGARTSVPIVFAFVLDTVQHAGGMARQSLPRPLTSDYLLPSAPGEPCMVLTRMTTMGPWGGVNGIKSTINTDFARDRVAGPCAFFARFGTPGEHVASWIRRHGQFVAAESNWSGDPRPESSSKPVWWRSPRHVLNPDGWRCTAGDAASCLRALELVDSKSETAASPVLIATAPYGYRMSSEWFSRGELGPSGRGLMAQLARMVGDDRFGEFWRSNLPVDEAFQRAVGKDLGVVTSEWAATTYGRERLGPGMTPIELIVAAGLAGLAIVGTIVAANRRFAT
jgi:hypothetical protein